MAKKLKIYNGSSWEDVTFAITPPATNVTNTFDTNQVIDTSTSVAALRVTQRGTGEAFRVEDSTNPDSSPFVIDAAGQVYVGSVNAASKIPTTRQYLNIGGTGGSGVIQLLDSSSSSILTGLIEFHDLQNTSNAGGTRNAYIAGWVDGTATANNRGGRIDFATKQDGTSNAAVPRMSIINSGLVGIGTTSPTYQLDLYNSSQQNVILTRLTTEAQASGEGLTSLRLEKGNGYGGDISGYLSQGVGSGLIFSSLNGGTSVERMRIASNGNVGLGNTNPQYKLDLANGFSSATVGDTSLFMRFIASAGNQDMLQMYSERTLSGGASWTTQDWVLRRFVDATGMGGIKWKAGEWNPTVSYGAPTSQSIRTTYISTGTPSGGIDGDMWATYV